MPDLRQGLKQADEFFAPKNHAELTLKYKLAKLALKYKREVALIVIDVQKQFCDPEGLGGNAETKAVSERIQALAPEFRKAGIPVYVVYSSNAGKDFYKFTPDDGDTLIAKSMDSAFQGTNLKAILERDHKKLLLTCGFNVSACVKSTVKDALNAGYEVCLLQDLAANDDWNGDPAPALKEMRYSGVVMAPSDAILKHFRAPCP